MKKTLLLFMLLSFGITGFCGSPTPKLSSNGSLSLAGENVDISLMSNIIAVIPPWRGERFNSQNTLEVSESATGVIGVQQEGKRFDEFAVEEYSARKTIDGALIITLRTILKQDVPTNMVYQALMMPDYLLAGAKYTVTFPDGRVKTGEIPQQPANPTEPVELEQEFSAIAFDGYFGKLEVKVLAGPNLSLHERRANSIYNAIRGFELGARWDVVYDKPVISRIEVRFSENNIQPAPVLAPRQNPEAAKIKVDRLAVPLKPDYSCVPMPQNIKFRGGPDYLVRQGTRVVISGLEGVELDRLERAAIRVLGPEFPGLSTEQVRADMPKILIEVGGQGAPESYSVSVDERNIRISSPTARGAFHALQLLRHCVKNGAIAQFAVTDAPAFARRGIHLLLDKDSVEVSGAMIENLFAPLGINWLVAECQYVKWDSTKNIHQSWGASKEQVKELKKIADDNYMEFTPLFQTLGHSEWLFGNNQNIDLAEDPACPYAYNPNNPRLYPLIDSILEEVLDTFGNPATLHIGHDEVFNPSAKWPNQPESVKKGARAIFNDDVMHFYAICKKRNIELIMWHDMLLTPEECPENGAGGPPDNISELRKTLPKDIGIVFWRYSANMGFTDVDKVFAEGFKNLYGATWYDCLNISDMCRHGLEKGDLKGMLQTTWTGYHGNSVAVRDAFSQMYPYVQLALSSWAPPLGVVDSQRIFCDLMEGARPQDTAAGWTIDLSNFADVSIDPKNNVFLSPDHTMNLDALPLPGARVGAVEFRIAEYNHLPAAVSVKSRLAPKLANESFPVPVGLKASKLYFLHSTVSTIEKFKKQVATYRIRYTDGETVDVPVLFGIDIGALYSPINFDLAPMRALTITGADDTVGRIWYQTWNNPNPDKTIESVALVGDGVPVYWFALSAAE
ncbi:MAG: glycoside hydrolase family 20 zincin-like fold domain-containing protein [Victivallaceae bacterium]|nr:glycoside hydrolase family 20 zincin-like fold domain-containing protein [Victivallaceae bacterium]